MKFQLPILDFDFVWQNKPCKNAQTYIEQAQAQSPQMTFTVLDVLKMQNVPAEDKIWLLSKEDALPQGLQRLCAVSFVRETPIGGGETTLSLVSKEGIEALNVAEKFVFGNATIEELAWAAARAAAGDAARDAARGAAWGAARAAAWDAARAAAGDAAGDAAWDAAQTAQVQIAIKTIERYTQ